MAYKACFLETSQFFKEFKGWRLLLKWMKEKMINKEVMFVMILCFSNPKLGDETVPNLK